jgi:hypothetical protein
MTETKTALPIAIKFTTLDGKDLPIPNYFAVPGSRLEKFEQIAVAAQELLKARAEAIKALGAKTAQANVDARWQTLESVVSELQDLWDFKTA